MRIIDTNYDANWSRNCVIDFMTYEWGKYIFVGSQVEDDVRVFG